VSARASGRLPARAVTIAVKVRPRAGRAGIRGRRPDGSLEVALRAAPEGGAANAELVALVARALGVPPAAVAIVRGATSRAKLLRITGADAGAVARLGAALAPREPAEKRTEETRGHDEP
jgi:hypothetical protein